MRNLKLFEDFNKNKVEKYFTWTDKTGRGELPIEITETHIRNTWDLDEEDDNDISLENYLDDCYIDDIWETRTEKLVCIKII